MSDGSLEQNFGETFIKIKMDVDALEADMRRIKAKLEKEATKLENSFSKKMSKIRLGYDTSIMRLRIDQVKILHSRLKKELEQKIKVNADIFTIDKLRTKIQSTERALQGLREESNKSFFGQMFSKGKNLLATLGITAAIGGAIRLGKELFIDAASADAVRVAFNKLNKPGLLSELQRETKNTVSDLDLMLASVRSANFKIPLETLGKLLRFAQQRAKDTKEDVSYLVDSIVMGIGRKSPMILDNLGISAVELRKKMKGLNAETASVGDVAKAVSQIVDEEFERMGGTTDESIDKASRLKAIWKNFFTSIGSYLIPAGSALSDYAGKLLLAMTPIESNLERVNESAKEQRFQFELLVTKYNRLRDVMNKTDSENKEFNSTIAELKKLYPELLGNLDLQKGKLKDIETAYQNVRKEMEKNIRMEIRKAKVMDLVVEQENLIDKKDLLQDRVDELTAEIKLKVDGKIDDADVYDKASQSFVKRSDLLKRDRQILMQDIKALDKEIADYQTKIDDQMKGVDLDDKDGSGDKSNIDEQLAANLELLEKYFETVKFLDEEYFSFRKKQYEDEAAELKKLLGEKFDEEKFYHVRRKELAKDYMDYLKGILKEFTNGNEVFTFNAKGEIETPLSKSENFTNPPEQLKKVKQPNDKSPIEESQAELIYKKISDAGELAEFSFQASMDAMADSFHELVHIRVAQDASALTKIWANMANQFIYQVQRMIAQWLAFKMLSLIPGFQTVAAAGSQIAAALPSGGGEPPIPKFGGENARIFQINENYPLVNHTVNISQSNIDSRVSQLDGMVNGINKYLQILNANFVDLMIQQKRNQNIPPISIYGELGNDKIYLSNKRGARKYGRMR